MYIFYNSSRSFNKCKIAKPGNGFYSMGIKNGVLENAFYIYLFIYLFLEKKEN